MKRIVAGLFAALFLTSAYGQTNPGIPNGGGGSGGGGSGGGATADQTVFTQGTTPFVPVGGVFNDTATLSPGQEGTVRLTADRQMKVVDSAVLAAIQAAIPAGTNTIGGVFDAPFNTSQTNISASTSATPSTATTLIAANSARKKIQIKVEGAGVVCFSQFGTAAIGSAGTWCLKGATTANSGDGGSYATPGGMTDSNAFSMISTTASVLVTAWWQ